METIMMDKIINSIKIDTIEPDINFKILNEIVDTLNSVLRNNDIEPVNYYKTNNEYIINFNNSRLISISFDTNLIKIFDDCIYYYKINQVIKEFIIDFEKRNKIKYKCLIVN